MGETGRYQRRNDQNVRRLEKYLKINEQKLWMQRNDTVLDKGVSCLIIEICEKNLVWLKFNELDIEVPVSEGFDRFIGPRWCAQQGVLEPKCFMNPGD